MDFRRMRLISFRSGYDLRDGGRGRGPRSYGTIVARRVRKQQKERDRRADLLDEWDGGLWDQGPRDEPYFCHARGGPVDRLLPPDEEL